MLSTKMWFLCTDGQMFFLSLKTNKQIKPEALTLVNSHIFTSSKTFGPKHKHISALSVCISKWKPSLNSFGFFCFVSFQQSGLTLYQNYIGYFSRIFPCHIYSTQGKYRPTSILLTENIVLLASLLFASWICFAFVV